MLNYFHFWCSNFQLDGVYMKKLDQLVYDNATLVDTFIQRMQQTTRSTALLPVFALIGDFSLANNSLTNKLFDLYRVHLNVLDIFSSLKNFSFDRQLDLYLKDRKNIIWSLNTSNSFDTNVSNSSADDSLSLQYFFLYSLPGFCLFRQGDELGSNSMNQTAGLPSLSNKNSLINNLKLLNDRIKPKLNDLVPSKPVRTTTQVNRRPEPFANAGYIKTSDAYLVNDIYKMSVEFGSVLKMIRQINNYQTRSKYIFNSVQFYRNVAFLFNFSDLDMPIDKVIRFPSAFIESTQRLMSKTSIHLVYDSARRLPEYLRFDPKNNALDLYQIKAKHMIVIEY